MNYVRSLPLRRAVASLPCVACGIEGHTQAAHSNLYAHGKGGALKACDSAIMALCTSRMGVVGCHERLDQKIDITSEEAERLTFLYIATTYIALMKRQMLKVAA